MGGNKPRRDSAAEMRQDADYSSKAREKSNLKRLLQSGVAEYIGCLAAQGLRQRNQTAHRQVLFPAFDFSDVIAVNVHHFGKPFLARTRLFPAAADRLSDVSQCSGFCTTFHAGKSTRQ